MKNKTDVFNNREIYEKKIIPLLDDIFAICAQEHIPFICSFCVANNQNESSYENTMLSAYTTKLTLTNDVIAKHLQVMNGFEVVPRREVMTEIEYEAEEE